MCIHSSWARRRIPSSPAGPCARSRCSWVSFRRRWSTPKTRTRRGRRRRYNAVMLESEMIVAEPKKRRFTRDEYYKMAELGMFDGQRVELIDGEVIQMAPQMERHVVAIAKVARALRRAISDEYWIRQQAPISVDELSEPEPDIAVVPGAPGDYQEHPPRPLL